MKAKMACVNTFKFISGFALAVSVGIGGFNLNIYADSTQEQVEEVATESSITSLTVDEALEISIQHNTDILNSEADYPYTQQNYEDANDNLALEPDNYYSLKVQIAELKNDLDNYDADIQKTKDVLKYDIVKLFSDIANTQQSLDTEEKSLAVAKKELDISELKYQKGIISKSEYDEQNTSYVKNDNSLKNKKIELDNLFIDLNKLIGLDLKDTYSIELELDYDKIGEVDLDSKRQEDLENSIDLTKQKQNLDVSKYEYSTYNEYTSYSTKLSKENDIESKQRDIADTEIDYTNSLNNLYRDIINKETEIEKYNEQLEYKNKELSVIELKYSLGKATQLEIDKKNIEIYELEDTIKKAKDEHQLLIMKYENVNLR